MSWLQLVLGIISLAQWLAKTLDQNKTFAAGQTQAVADAFKRASDEITAALEAGRRAEDAARQGQFDDDLFRDKP